MTITSLVCPWNDLIGLSEPSLQTWMHLSVELQITKIIKLDSLRSQ